MLQCGGAALLLCIKEASSWEILKTSDRDRKIILKTILHQALLYLLSLARPPKPWVTRLEKSVGWLCHPSAADAAKHHQTQGVCHHPPVEDDGFQNINIHVRSR